MAGTAEQTARALGRAGALAFNRGIEREALRVTPKGELAASAHPPAFGSKLTHPLITTDFSEAQLELITGVHQSTAALLAELDLVHRAVQAGLGDELLWPASMPCRLGVDGSIPLADYGESNLGRLKTCYRSGLGLRYGRAMQTICAVHYNFSPTDEMWAALKSIEGSKEAEAPYRSRRYFDLMRNFRRHAWLLLYLFGASPALSNSFLRGRNEALTPLDQETSYLPYASSLRSGKLGYQSDTQAAELFVCYNSLETYVASLAEAICQPHPAYAQLGAQAQANANAQQAQGQRPQANAGAQQAEAQAQRQQANADAPNAEAPAQLQQVNANVLQAEAEFYASIRAKQPAGDGENLLARLQAGGVQYVEVRLLDVNPYLPLGIDAAQIDFIDVFLTHCLLTPSPYHDDALCREVDVNMQSTVLRGRDPALRLSDQGRPRPLRDWAAALFTELQSLATAIGDGRYEQAVAQQLERLENPNLTPSGQLLQDLQAGPASFVDFAMELARAHNERLAARPLSPAEQARFAALRDESLAAQATLEQAEDTSFADYVARLMASYATLAPGE